MQGLYILEIVTTGNQILQFKYLHQEDAYAANNKIQAAVMANHPYVWFIYESHPVTLLLSNICAVYIK